MGLITPNFMLARPIPDVRYLGSDFQGDSESSTRTFTGVSIGAASTVRRIFICCALGNDNGSPAISSATIGGVSATLHVSSGTDSVAIFSAVVPTGTTATVVINMTSEADFCDIYVYRALNVASGTAVDTDSDDNGGKSGTISLAVNVSHGGFVIAIGRSASTVSGVTEDDDNFSIVGSARLLQTQTNRPISFTSALRGCAASFR